MSKPDVFISYRRDKGAELAQLVYSRLHAANYSVFLDTRHMPSGPFPAALARTIGNAPNFVVLLTQGALDTKRTGDDWFLNEISCAFRTERHIHPLKVGQFDFPSSYAVPTNFKNELTRLSKLDIIAYSHAYADAALEKLRGRLVIEEAAKKRNVPETFLKDRLVGTWRYYPPGLKQKAGNEMYYDLKSSGDLTITFPQSLGVAQVLQRLVLGREVRARWWITGQKLHIQYIGLSSASLGKISEILARTLSAVFMPGGGYAVKVIGDDGFTMVAMGYEMKFERV